MNSSNPQDLFKHLVSYVPADKQQLPPVQQWNPSLCGDMPVVIRRDGSWYHDGGKINRMNMVKLFASLLKKEEEQYFLVTPVEKWRIDVEEAPFCAVSLKIQGRGDSQLLYFTTNLGDLVIAGPEHPLWVEDRQGQPFPFLHVRDGLNALINRAVFYQLVEVAQEALPESVSSTSDGGTTSLDIASMGQYFSLGSIS